MNDDNLGVEFEEDTEQFHIRSRKILGEKTTPGVIRFLLDKKIVKTEIQATIFVSISIALFLVLSIFIITNSVRNPGELVVIDKFGREIPFETYQQMLRNGEDPLR